MSENLEKVKLKLMDALGPLPDGWRERSKVHGLSLSELDREALELAFMAAHAEHEEMEAEEPFYDPTGHHGRISGECPSSG